MIGRQALADFHRAIPAAVINQNDFEIVSPARGSRNDPPEQFPDAGLFVVGGNDDRDHRSTGREMGSMRRQDSTISRRTIMALRVRLQARSRLETRPRDGPSD